MDLLTGLLAKEKSSTTEIRSNTHTQLGMQRTELLNSFLLGLAIFMLL
jgi:hypothetical protein